MLIKKIITAGILFVILATSVAPVGVRAQGTACTTSDGRPGTLVCATAGAGGCQCNANASGNNTVLAGATDAAKNIASGALEVALYNSFSEGITKIIGWTLQRISSLFLLISGLLFDKVITETVVEMSKNLSSDGGIGLSINQAWVTLRDIANMVFIFVLLYTAFNAMFTNGVGNVGRNIAWIIIIALVINFSLFFSKVVIDASNVVSLGFYKAIANTGSYELTLENKTSTGTTTEKKEFKGISAGYMRMLGIHSFWSTNTNTENIHGGQNVLIMGILTAVFVLVAAVILFITSIMFVSRFVILIFIMILSPVAFVMYIIPGMSGKFNEWWKALINQAFFAPVFFALTWVVFKIGSSMSVLSNSTENGVNWTQIVSAPSAMMGLVINYFIIIGLSIFALTAAKKMASSVSQFTAVSTALGGAAVGGSAIIGRQTMGRAASRIAQSRSLQDWGARSALGQKVLQGTKGIAGSSFDIRGLANTGIAKSTKTDELFSGIGSVSEKAKGGFDARVQRKIASKEKFSQTLTTDDQKQAYAQRQAGKPMVRGGSQSSWNSIFGAVGRSNRVVASRILSSQLQPWVTQRDNLNNALQNQQNRDTALNQQLNTAQANLIALQNIQNPTPQQVQQITNIQNNINNIQNQIQTNQTNMNNTQNQLNAVNTHVNNLNGQINNLGLTNPTNTVQLTPQQQAQNMASQAAGQPAPNVPRASRADEQNF